jgi:hypothetical protein
VAARARIEAAPFPMPMERGAVRPCDPTNAGGQQRQSTSQIAVLSFLELTSPSHPASRLPRMLGQLMPRPLVSIEELRRFTGDDVAELSARAARHEAWQLRVAVALLEDVDDVPLWAYRRLAALDARASAT